MIQTLRRTYAVFIPEGQRAKWLGLILLALAVAGAETVTAFFIFRVLGFATDPDPSSENIELAFGLESTLVPLLFIAGAVFVLRGFMSMLSVYAQSRVVQSAAADVSTSIHRGYLQAPYRFHLTRSSSESVRTVLWSVDQAANNALNPIINVFTQGLIAGMLYLLLVGIAPVLSIVAAVVLAGGLTIVLLVIQPRLSRIGKKSEKTVQRMLARVRDSFDSVRDIKAYRAEDYFDARFGRQRHILAGLRVRKTLLDVVPSTAVEFMVVLGLLALIGVAKSNDSFTDFVPVLGAFGYATLRIVPSVNKIVAGANRLKFGEEALKNVERDLEAGIPAEVADRSVAPATPLFTDRIELNAISFTYPEADKKALDNVDLVIKRGEVLAIAGGSGSGKSTLVDVVLGLLEPDTGVIAIDGSTEPPEGWHQKVGIVSQTVVLLDASVRDNVAFGDASEADDALVLKALERAKLGTWLAALPDGLDTTVGESGKLVSGGERQRIAIARSLYRNPDLLILDEATSALDAATEAALIETLIEMSGELTAVIVSHRLAPIQAAHRVAVMSNGRVAAVGRYEDLAADTMEFRDLVGL